MRQRHPAGPMAQPASALVMLAVLLSACTDDRRDPATGPASESVGSSGPASASSGPTADGGGRPAGVPHLRVRALATGYDHIWDVQRAGADGWLFTERDAARLHLLSGGRVTDVEFPSETVWVSGETGLMSLAVDPEFGDNRRFYTCQGGYTSEGHDVRVMAWRLSDDGSRAEAGTQLVGGFPTTSGRHGGCRLLIDRRSGALWIGTGDAADEANAHHLDSLGGKVLRIDRFTGRPWPDNPWVDAADPTQRYLYDYGHRNVQGLAQRADGTVWSVEHGPDRDDEINLLQAGGDYGWDPGPGYDESVPMTDQSLPGDQVEARWSSGYPTLATSGAAWVRGRAWGALRGSLAVAALKAGRVVFVRFDSAGRYVGSFAPPELQRYGRLRSVTAAPTGELLLTTDNGGGDAILLVSPSGT